MAGSEWFEARRTQNADARANRSVLDSPLKKAGDWLFDLLYSDEPNPADFVMPAAAPETRALTPLAQAVRDRVIRILRPVKAFHGSPFKFDQFKLSPREGQGAASYGEGLYFAGARPTAEEYARDLMGSRVRRQFYDRASDAAAEMPGAGPTWHAPIYSALADEANELGHFSSSADGVLYQLERQLEQHRAMRMPAWEQRQVFRDIQQARAEVIKNPGIIDELRAGMDLSKPEGYRYEVNLHVDPQHDLLDWDLPLGEQSSTVRRALYDVGMPAKDVRNMARTMKGDDIYRKFQTLSREAEGRPGIFETGHDELQDALAASKGLNDRGVAGIQYLDAQSRPRGRGTRNYVIFDPKRVEIVRQYGVPLAAGSAGLADLLYGDHTGQRPGTVTTIR